MTDAECVAFLQQALPRLGLRWAGFRKVRAQVRKRLARRLAALGLADLAAYRRRLERDPREWAILDSLCRISVSRFYRDRAVFDRLAGEILPALTAAAAHDRPRVRLWSAGCASGEEPYTVALCRWLGAARNVPALLEIVATDADHGLIARALAACYPQGCLADLPAGWRERAFARRGEGFCLRVKYRVGIDFVCQDIRRDMPAGPFDLVLCRNLAFTYFDDAAQRRVLTGLAARLRPGGRLLLGAHEALPEGSEGFVAEDRHLAIWRRTPAAVAGVAAAAGR
jgi:chemotaxis protein methyltransferase CheR